MARSIISALSSMSDGLLHSIHDSPFSAELSNIAEDLDWLKRTWLRINAVLTDAEELEIRKEEVRLWLCELRALALDAEDVLDEYLYELRRCEVEGHSQEPQAAENEVSRFFISPLTDTDFRRALEEKVQSIKDRFDEIAKQRKALHLKKRDGQRRCQGGPSLDRQPTGSLNSDPCFYGRGKETMVLMDWLSNMKNDLDVIAIVGMGGVGKTTVAQRLYNDPRVCARYEKRGWLCVSNIFDVVGLTNSALEAIRGEPAEYTVQSVAEEELKNVVERKRFLLVLDDVWDEQQHLLGSLMIPLRFGHPGSKVLLTTRHEHIAKNMRSAYCHRLRCLSDDDCWLLFKKHAFGSTIGDLTSNLESIGRKIAGKCKGLPLAVKTLGRLLWQEVNEEKWREVLESDLWDSEKEDNKILAPLKLSYHHLPPHLKPCFALCSMFPKGCDVEKEDLVYVWMAHDLIQGRKGKSSFENGSEYVDNLLSRSLQTRPGYGDSYVQMHDLIHDLALNISAREFSKIDDDSIQDVSSTTPPLSSQKFRTIRVFIPSNHSKVIKDNSTPNGILLHLRNVRVLHLEKYLLYNDPMLFNSIGKMKHLRYLSCRDVVVPSSISMLYNLQILFCSTLPRGISLANLTNLRHLCFSYCSWIPSGIGRLTNLERLIGFAVVPEDMNREFQFAKIEELKDLVSLKVLTIFNLPNVKRAEDAKAISLSKKKHLKRLELSFNEKRDAGVNDYSPQVLEALEPYTNLVELTISWYRGLTFPNWLVDPPSPFEKLTTVKLHACCCNVVLPTLGHLPSLQFLVFRKCQSVKQIGREFYYYLGNVGIKASFPSLRELSFYSMKAWEEWVFRAEGVEHRHLPQLDRLHLSGCPRLSTIPVDFTSLKILVIEDCPNLFNIPFLPNLVELWLSEFLPAIWILPSNLPKLGALKIKFYLEKSIPLYKLTSVEDLTLEICWELERIEFWAPECLPTPSSTTSTTSFSPSTTSVPNASSIKTIRATHCPCLRFPPEQRLPSTLKYLELNGETLSIDEEVMVHF